MCEKISAIKFAFIYIHITKGSRPKRSAPFGYVFGILFINPMIKGLARLSYVWYNKTNYFKEDGGAEMKGIFRFIAKHRILCSVLVLFCAAICGAFVEIDSILINACIIFLASSVFTFINMTIHYLVNGALPSFENCDPIPLYEETKYLLGVRLSRIETIPMLVNHAAALRYMGDGNRAYEIMHGIDEKDVQRAGPMCAIVYYNNFVEYCVLLGLYEEADIWNSRLIEEYGNLKIKRLKRVLSDMYDGARMYEMMREGRYAEALSILNGSEPKNKLQAACRAIERARLYKGLGETEKAREALSFAIENAGKTSLGAEAEQMLEYLDTQGQ